MKLKTSIKILISLGIMLLLVLLFNVNTVKAETYDSLIYEIYNNNITITGTTNKDVTEVVIPREINGIEVTNISNEAFWNCIKLKSVVIPNTIRYIGGETIGSFCGCVELENIEIPDSVLYIGEATFKDCIKLKSVKLSNNIDIINQELFMNCTSLTEVNIPENVKSIKNNAFYGCTSLTELEIPDKITSIAANEEFAFANCNEKLNLIVTEGLYAEEFANDNKLDYSYNNKKDIYNKILDSLPDKVIVNISKNENLDEKLNKILIAPEEYKLEKISWMSSNNLVYNVVIALQFKDDDENYYSQNLAKKDIKVEYITDDIEKILDLIPDSIQLDVREIDFREAKLFSKFEEIKEELKQKLIQNNIIYLQKERK